MELETIRGRLVGDSSHFVVEMNRGANAMGNVTAASGRSNKALNTLKGGMVALAAQATGTAGPIGKLVQGLLLFGGGSTLILGVAAGVGAIAIAYQALTADAREAEEATKDLIARLQELGAHGKLVAARIELGRLQTKLENAEALQRRAPESPSVAAAVTNAQSAIATKLVEIAALEREVEKWQRGIAEAAGDAARQEAARFESLKDGLSVMLRMKGVMQDMAAPGKSFLSEEAGFKKDQFAEAFLGKGSDFQGQLEKVRLKEFLPPDDDIRQLGISAGRQLMMGMMQGFEDMKDVLRSVLMTVLDFAIGSILGGAFKVAGGGISADAKGIGSVGKSAQSVSGAALAPMTLSLSGLQPMTAYAVARDPAFQQVLREGILVGRAAGFR